MTDNIPQPAFGQYAATPSQQWSTSGGGLVDPVPERKGLGLASMIIALVVFALSLVASVLVGLAAGPLLGQSSDFTTGFNNGYELGSSPEGGLLAVGMLAHIGLGTLFGVGAIVLGIVAIVIKRGGRMGSRAWRSPVPRP